ncbi:lysophospholipid acyltransferase family protein [Crocinitomicaceae bacterium]|jgi:Kdo2-lipid IVA lauroyltransferase/acyltransferase|nr:lysophospholipid acyltransferase family protein [Crocinitomicaceae bacterium]
MFSKLAYYLLVIPISLLPLWVLYLFTDFFYLLLISIISYRRGVVRKNIANSFSDKTEKERRKIERKFYRHFTDLLAEGVKNLSISKMQLKKRIHVQNRDEIDQLYIQGKNVIFVGGHYNNWEWIICAQNFLFAHQAVGIGMPMTNTFWDKRINLRRSRFGMKIVHAKNFKETLRQENGNPISLLILADQSPGDSMKSYWTKFLNQDTAVAFGVENIAHEYNYAVVFLHMTKVKRGYYNVTFELICDLPSEMQYGEITDAHVKSLENDIYKDPQYWIWSHKRWKREIPENLEELRKRQYEKFIQRYRS